MRFGIIANLNRPGADSAITDTLTWANNNGHEVLLSSNLAHLTTDSSDTISQNLLAEQVDMVVSMGGDGTLLASARAVGKAETPLLGINLGSLGFMTQQPVARLIPALDKVASGEYFIEERMLLKAGISNGQQFDHPYALNDIVLDNGAISRAIDIHLLSNGEEVVTYSADGLIIATPTGSTAYSLAVGGPIVSPSLKAMIASPISAFSLTARPMVFSGDDVLELRVSTHGGEAILTLDGQIRVTLKDHDCVTIRRGEFCARLVRFPENSYYDLLRTKLNWGILPSS